MNISDLKDVFNGLKNWTYWNLHLLKVTNSQTKDPSYSCRQIYLAPDDKIVNFMDELCSAYVSTKSPKLDTFEIIQDYDGSALGNVIYTLPCSDRLVSDAHLKLVDAVLNSDVEDNPFELKSNAYIIKGYLESEDKEELDEIMFITMQNPVTLLKNKYMWDKGKFKELTKQILTLKLHVDVIVYKQSIYLLNMSGEKLFNMERSYKAISKEKVNTVLACKIITDDSVFSTIALSGHNPRRFVSFNHVRLIKLQEPTYRASIASKFSIPLVDDKFDTSLKENAEKLIKLLCNKGMVDPFEDVPVEVAGAKIWQ